MLGHCMTKSMTGSFYLTETVITPTASADGTVVSGTVDLSAYVNVPTGQAIAIESVDFVWQVTDAYNGLLSQMGAGTMSWTAQLTDLNPGTTLVRADSQTLVASGNLQTSGNLNQATHTQDLYPDNFGPASLSEAFLVVNDTLYLSSASAGQATTANVYLTARIRCRVVKLSNKDWMAIAIQSTAEA